MTKAPSGRVWGSHCGGRVSTAVSKWRCGVWGVGAVTLPLYTRYNPKPLGRRNKKMYFAGGKAQEIRCPYLKLRAFKGGVPTPHTLPPTPYS
jgi:hypothetical protein